MSKSHITWEQFQRDTEILAELIKSRQESFIGIVAIARGGYIPATIIAHRLGIKNVRSISISSYDDIEEKQQKNIQVNSIFNTEEKWLVIDELVDSGNSLELIRKYHPNSLFAVVYAKPKGLDKTDLHAVSVPQTTWLVFPWE